MHVYSIDRLADLQTIIETLTKKGITVKFYKEHLSFEAANTSPMQTLMLQMLGAFAEFERTLIKERQREGIDAAKAQGKKLGAPAKLATECFTHFPIQKVNVNYKSIYYIHVGVV